MKIIYSDHAKQQRIERKINQKAIIATIKNPDSQETSFRNRQLFRKRFGDKILEVVVTKENDNLIIVTEYFLTEETNL